MFFMTFLHRNRLAHLYYLPCTRTLDVDSPVVNAGAVAVMIAALSTRVIVGFAGK